MKIFVAAFFFLMTNTSFAQMKCEQVFLHSNISVAINTAIDSAIANLAQLRLSLDKNKIAGTDSIATRELESDYSKKANNLLQYLVQNNIMTREELKINLRSKIVQLQSKDNSTSDIVKKEEQKRIFKESLTPIRTARKTTFNELPSKKFQLQNPHAWPWEKGYHTDIELMPSFSMMATPVTQAMWAQIKALAGEKNPTNLSPSFFNSGSQSVVDTVQGIQIRLQPDHPVEQVTFEEVEIFIKQLNVLSKKNSQKIQEQLKLIIPDHQQGDRYDLPTRSQWEYVMTIFGSQQTKFFDLDEERDLHKYGWSIENSKTEEFPEGQTHAVAELFPRMIDGKAFYDLEGNVWEWTKDLDDGKMKGGKDPSFVASEKKRVMSGGCYGDEANNMSWQVIGSWAPNVKNPGIGFRMIRTRP